MSENLKVKYILSEGKTFYTFNEDSLVVEDWIGPFDTAAEADASIKEIITDGYLEAMNKALEF